MASLHRMPTIFLLLLFSSLQLALSADSSRTAPTPSPASEILADSLRPAPESGAPLSDSPPTSESGAPASVSPQRELSSPPAPPPSDRAPGPTPNPSPAPSPSDMSPAPVPFPTDDISPEPRGANAADEEENESPESDGLKGGQKAGIVFGVVGAGLCAVCCGGMVYRKRQKNIRRARYLQVEKMELL